jgi:endonuclease/exonuclease/phosphatase family metal-dependent hydrolase
MPAKAVGFFYLILTLWAQAVGVRVATFNIGAHFTAEGFPDYSLGNPGTADHDKVRDVLGRINADVVALQEIASADVSGSPSDLGALATSLGYPHVYVAPVSGEAPLAGPIDTSLRVAILSRYPFLSTSSVRSPEAAKEITRLFPIVKVDIPGTSRDPLIISAHLKSGTATADRFRRTLEMRRLTDRLSALGLTIDDNFIIMGDFNLSSNGITFTTPPSGLPVSFDLGADIILPISYSTNPLSYFANPRVSRLDPRQLNNSTSTFQSGSTIDLFLVSPAIAGRPLGTEIYNSTLDTSNSSGLAKAGVPLATTTSAAASDHYALFADLELDENFPNLDLALSVSSVREGAPDGSAEITVTLPAIRSTAVTVEIVSNDPTAAAPLFPSLTIPAGMLRGTMAIRTVRNFMEEPQRNVTLTASATGYDPDSRVLQVDEADGPYLFTAPGETVTETFAGFPGTLDPMPWMILGSRWQGMDGGASAAAGFRAYGSTDDPSLGFLPAIDGGTATANFLNQSTRTLTALRIGFSAEQWRGALAGSADTLGVELVVDGSASPLPDLAFQAANHLPTGAIAGGNSMPKSTTVSKLAIAPGASFQLRFTFTPGAGSGTTPADIFINEFHYDNASNDSGEFIEVVVGPGFSGNLSEVVLVLYNGSDGKPYGTHALSTFTAGAVTSSGFRIHSKQIDGIQNGNPDGFALVYSGVVTRFISYGGSFTATTGPATGMTSTDVGVKQTGNEAVGQSAIYLTGSGDDSSDFTWSKSSSIPHSPGQANSGQTFAVATLPSQGIAFDDLSVSFLPDHDNDGSPDDSDPDDDNDGISDTDELVFASNPLDANSRFAMTLFRSPAAPGALRISFPTAAGRNYAVESSIDLTIWNTLAVSSGTGLVKVIDLTLPPLERNRFYRVRVSLP